MEMCSHDLQGLFLQLGLLCEPLEMEEFASSHQLILGTKLSDAPYWSVSQLDFLLEALAHDSAWSNATDHLAIMLNKMV